MTTKAMDRANMPLLNGMFHHFPDANSITAAGTVGVNWRLVEGTGGSPARTISRQAFTFGQIDVPFDPTYFLRMAFTTAPDTTTEKVQNRIENVRTFAGRRVSLQFMYRSNAAIDVKAIQCFGTGGSPSSDVSITKSIPSTVDAAGTAQWRSAHLVYDLATLYGKTLGSTANTHYLAISFEPGLQVCQVDLADVRITAGGERATNPPRGAEIDQHAQERYFWSRTVKTINGVLTLPHRMVMRATPTMSADVGTGGDASIEACTLTHSAAADAVLTASALL